MATWGYRLHEDDTFCEVIEAFKEKLHSGISVEQIPIQIRRELGGEFDDHIVQLAIAEGLWRVNALSKKELICVREILESGKDYEYWLKLGADTSFLKKRSTELEQFLDRISQVASPRQIWSIDESEILLDKGSCFWYKSKGCIYGAVVLEIQGDENCYYLIALSDELHTPPTTSTQVVVASLYTIAWFNDSGLLNKKRIHFLDNVDINTSFLNRYGLKSENGKSISITNCGQPYTWSHSYRAISFPDRSISDIIAHTL